MCARRPLWLAEIMDFIPSNVEIGLAADRR